MARGRKRKPNVPRGANGQILTSHKDAARGRRIDGRDAKIAVLAQRAKMVVDHLIKDQRFNTPLGQMLFLGHPRAITAQLFAAGEIALRRMEAYDRVVLGIRRTPSPSNLFGDGGASLSEGPDDETVDRVTRRMMDLEGVLGRVPGGSAVHATKALVRGEALSGSALDRAIAGLKAVAEAYEVGKISDGELKKAARRTRFIGEEKLLEPLAIE